VDLGSGTIRNVTKGSEIESHPLPRVMLDILSEGGLVEYMKKHGRLTLE
jgi:3-isopropylmalate/(R)-2-methylmalate dehydratase small subunit